MVKILNNNNKYDAQNKDDYTIDIGDKSINSKNSQIIEMDLEEDKIKENIDGDEDEENEGEEYEDIDKIDQKLEEMKKLVRKMTKKIKMLERKKKEITEKKKKYKKDDY